MAPRIVPVTKTAMVIHVFMVYTDRFTKWVLSIRFHAKAIGP